MNEKTRWFKFLLFAWLYYWRLRIQGLRPSKPCRQDTFLWGQVWVVEWPVLRKAP